jgi:hypothetical protein
MTLNWRRFQSCYIGYIWSLLPFGVKIVRCQELVPTRPSFSRHGVALYFVKFAALSRIDYRLWLYLELSWECIFTVEATLLIERVVVELLLLMLIPLLFDFEAER